MHIAAGLTVRDVYIRKIVFNVSSPPQLEKLMSELADKLNTLNATLEATSAALTKISGEQSSLLDSIADLTDKLAAALAAGQAVPPEVVAAVERANATAAAIKGKADVIDGLVADVPVAP